MTRFQVWLNGISLLDADPSIRITDVCEHSPNQLTAAAARARGDGMRLLQRTRQSLSVTVRFTLRNDSPLRRKAALAAVLTWAGRGGWLTFGDRPGQRLYVAVDSLPSLESALSWTEELSLGFIAYTSPYWEELVPTRFSPGSRVHLPGNAPDAPVDLCWTAPGGSVSLQIKTPLSAICLDAVPTSAGQQLVLSHTEGVPVITLDGKDILVYRSCDSSDDLLLPCGKTSTVEVSCNGSPVQGCTLTARGRWL